MSKTSPEHLIILVHGLADTLHAWDNCVKVLRNMNSPGVLLHASAVNGRWKTHDGLDVCGERLVAEIRDLVQQHPQLKKLSVVCHSLGGMIARYAMGVLFKPSSGTVCGLKPVHFITLATPHLGLTVDDGPVQVPFVTWAGHMPLIGRGLKRALQAVASSVARTLFRRTGRQFLALDAGPGQRPLLLLLATDVQETGQYFFSALKAFSSRACYGNVGRDHWVSWHNATIRAKDERLTIPEDIVRRGRGVVREDPPAAGLSTAPALPISAPEELGAAEGGALTVDAVDVELAGEGGQDVPQQVVVEFALAHLRRLPWRRVDVSFAGARMGSAHKNIQATGWTNRIGLSVLEHLRAHLQDVDRLLADLDDPTTSAAAEVELDGRLTQPTT